MAESIFIKYYEDTDCLHGYSVERTVELTRQEAIERMAKALRINIVETQAQCSCLNMAETALNALLEAEK